MKKEEFLRELRRNLAGLPKDEIDNRVDFYAEMIEDRIDEGLEEEEAVAQIGSVDDIVNDIAKDTHIVKLIKEKVKPKRQIKTWEIVLLVLGFPLWFPLAVTGILLCAVGYLLIWVFDIAAYAIECAFGASFIAGLIAFFAAYSDGVTNYLPLGIAVASLGGVFAFYNVCVVMTKGTFRVSKRIVTKIKARIIKKGSN
jgi:uncharacterized membrane protein